MSRDAYGSTGITGLRFYLMRLGKLVPSCVCAKSLTSGEGAGIFFSTCLLLEGFFILIWGRLKMEKIDPDGSSNLTAFAINAFCIKDRLQTLTDWGVEDD